ncbi:MAG: M23 family metallopeptidase [Bdellovibrionales bacterium]
MNSTQKRAFALGLVSLFAISWQAAACDKMFCVRYEPGPEGTQVKLTASAGRPVSVKIESQSSDLASSESLPKVVELKGGQTITAIVVKNVTQPQDLKALKFSGRWGLLSVSQPSESFQLPFDHKNSYQLIQGFFGKGSHQGRRLHALDFAMTEGTSVWAARDGRVILIKDQFTQTTLSDAERGQANQVWLLHEDGTISVYSHLRQKGIKVNVGDQVRAGQFLAQSGMTGAAKIPHLHFDVSRPSGFESDRHTVPFKIRLPSGQTPEHLETSKFYP